MPHSRFDWHERIKAVEREYSSTRFSVERLSAEVAVDRGILGAGRDPRDLVSANANLEGTYLIRMFAEFESGIRSFWRTVRPRARTPAETLLNSVGTRRHVPSDVIRNAQYVRAYRNALVHERDDDVDELSIAESRQRLQTFFARLPDYW
jgi:hypothetical protein